MITFSKAKDFAIQQGKRILQVLQFGAKTAKVASAYGDDSNPIDNMTAIYAETSVNSEPVILGYINTQQIAQKGEKRIFSQKENGDLAFEIYLKNDGSCEIKSAESDATITLTTNGNIQINGNGFSAVRFQNLQSSLQQLDSQINQQLTLIASGISSAGGAYTPTPVQTDISNAESDSVKLK